MTTVNMRDCRVDLPELADMRLCVGLLLLLCGCIVVLLGLVLLTPVHLIASCVGSWVLLGLFYLLLLTQRA